MRRSDTRSAVALETARADYLDWLVIAVMPMIPVMILMVPVAFMQLPALFIVVVVGMVPIGSIIGRTIPAPRHPSVVSAMRGPVTIDPSIARARSRTTLFMTIRRRGDSDVHPNLR